MKIIVVFIFVFCNLFCSGQQQFALYFDTSKAVLSASELVRFKNWIGVNKESKILAINGYTDEDGTNDYNDSLSKKRVDFIYATVKNSIAIRDDFQSRSFGENFKQSKNKAENRKVIVFFIEKKDLALENEILGLQQSTNQPSVKTPRVFASKYEMINTSDGSVLKIDLNQAFMSAVDRSKPGEKLVIDNLNFVINTFIVTNSSRPKLFEILTDRKSVV